MIPRRFRVQLLCLLVAGLPTAVRGGYEESPHTPYDPYPVFCVDCHSIHNASYPNLLGRLCDYCHYDGGPAPDAETHSSRTTDAGYGNWDLDCWSCHDPHTQEQNNAFGTTYGKYIRHVFNAVEIKEIDPADPGPYYDPISILRTVSGTDVKFTSQTEFVDGDASASDDICQVCHESTVYYSPTALNAHADYGADSQPGGNCTTCHIHTEGFYGGSCVSCHDQPQPVPGEYRDQVTGPGGAFERPSHHVTDGTTTEIVTDDDCVVCHDQSDHQNNVDPAVLLNDADGGAGYAYDGTGASIAGFCLSCHDVDGAVAYGGTPFSDNRTPQDIASEWNSSSHSGSLPAEDCLACHGGEDATRVETVTDHSAHGSDAPTLLSTLVAGEWIATVEEELCFACHDADGDAQSDIESRFALPVRWVTAPAGQNANSNLNDRHDVLAVAQAISGANVDCVDCHDPHAEVTGAESFALRADPDPDDGRVPGTGQVLAGADFLTEWCLDCHDDSLPTSVTPPTTALKNVRSAYQTEDAHGLLSGNPALKAGYGWAAGDLVPCSACHRRHHVTANRNLFQLVDLVKSKDGSTDIPSDGAGLAYELTDNSVKSPSVNGYEWCNTCHTGSMGAKKDNCFACHFHGDRF